MPASDSATCAVSAEMRVRTSAKAVCERVWNQRATTSVGGRITIVASARRQSRMASAIIAPVSVRTLPTSVERPLREHVGERVDVVRDARDDPARALLREVAQRERREVPEEVLAQAQDDQLTELREAEDQERADEPRHGVDADVDGDIEIEARRVVGPDAVVDRVAHEQPAADLHRRGERGGEREHRDAPALIADVDRQAGEPDAAPTRHGLHPRRGARTCRRPCSRRARRRVLDDHAVLEHDRAVGQRDRRQALAREQHGASRERGPQPAHDLLLVLGVDGRERVVEHEHARARDERPGERHALALAAREVDAALADQRVVAIRAGRR